MNSGRIQNSSVLGFKPPDHWQFHDVSEIHSWNCQPLVWIIENLIAVQNLVIMAGVTQARKTLLGLFIALAVATGNKLFGKFATRKARVLYLALEDPDRRIKDRILDMGLPVPGLGQFMVLIAPGLNLGDPQLIEYLKSLIAAHGFEIVFLDTYQKATPGLSSFDDEKQSEILHDLSNLTRTHKVALVILDHLRKERSFNNRISIEDIKGTGGKAQNADAVILVERKKGGQMHLTCNSKDSDQQIDLLIDVSAQGQQLGEKFTLVADLTQPGDHEHVKPDPNGKKIRQALLDHGDWCASSDIRQKTSLSPSTIRRTIEQLLTSRLVESNGKKGRWARYRTPVMRFGINDLE